MPQVPLMLPEGSSQFYDQSYREDSSFSDWLENGSSIFSSNFSAQGLSPDDWLKDFHCHSDRFVVTVLDNL
jgi:hypothetical protein